MRKNPNIVFIMADDMGYGDVGCYNPESRIPTPNMDRLAAEGMLYTDAHAPSSICTPTRYGVLTGRYCWRTRLKEGVSGGYERPLIEPGRLTLASMLKAKGYHTACIGKWHVGLTFHDKDGNPTEVEEMVDFSRSVDGGPADLGFDYSYYNAGCGTCAPPYGFIENRHFVDKSFYFFETGKDGPVSVGKSGQWRGMMGSSWVTKDADPMISQKACAYIEGRKGKEAPFFLYLAPNAPHEPCQQEFVPDFAIGKSKAGSRGDLVWLFDWVVGQVTETLERTGQFDNTLVIVTSDNGALPGDFALDASGDRIVSGVGRNEYAYRCYDHKSNGDWRGYKAHIWDGGHRMPFITRCPDMIAGGTTSNELICLTDVVATCAALAGFDLPDDAAEDSCSILPVLLGKANSARPVREAVVHHSGFGVFSIRQGRWKLIHECLDSGGWPTPRGSRPVPGSPSQLYDMVADPHEENNLWEERKDVAARLAEWLNRYRRLDRDDNEEKEYPSDHQ